MQKFATRNSKNSTDHFYNIKADLPEPPSTTTSSGREKADKQRGPSSAVPGRIYQT